jgi:hypothetical protein
VIIDEDIYLEHFDNETTINHDVDAFLEHYGIMGMKWGIRNAPKNLKKSFFGRQERIRSTKAGTLEARAAKSKVRMSELNNEINALPGGMKNAYKKSMIKSEYTLNQNQREKDLKQAKNVRKSRITPTQKKVLIGAAVVGGIFAAGYLSTRVDHETVASAVRRAQSESEHGSIFKINKDLAAPNLSASEIVTKISKSVNPNYASPGGQMNCRRSTFTHELRRRGFDVKATPSALGRAQNETGLVNAVITGDRNPIRGASLSSMLNREGTSRARPSASDKRTYKAFTERVDDIDTLSDRLSKQPNRSRGEVVFEETGFAHSMAYEVIDGMPHIFDSQKAVHYPATKEGLSNLVSKWGAPSAMEITRLDNVDLDLVWLSRWSANAA